MMVRKARENDATDMALIFNAYMGKSHMVTVPRRPKECIELMLNERAQVLVAHDFRGWMMGYASVKPYSERGGYVGAGEVSIFMAPQHTGKGGGQDLYNVLLPIAAQLGYHHLTAKIWTKNTGSIRFHERNGFRTVGIQHGIGMSGGRRIDMTIMERLGAGN